MPYVLGIVPGVYRNYHMLSSHTSVNFFYFLRIYFWPRWAFVAVCGLSLVTENGATLQLWYEGFSLQWLLLLGSAGSRHSGFNSCGSWALEHRLNSCSTQAQMLCGMWDLPKSGIEPVSPALAGRFFTTEPPQKPLCVHAQSPIVSNSL